MSWIKLDDQFAIKGKVTSVGPLGIALHIAGLCHCGRDLTDGFVRDSVVRGIAAMVGIYEPEPVVAALVDAGLWHRVKGGFEIHDYLEYNPSKARVEGYRAARAERQARWRAEHRREDGAFGDNDGGDDGEGDDDVDTTVTHNVTRYETRDRQPLPVPHPHPHPHPHPVPVPEPVVGVREAAPKNDDDNLLAYFWKKLENASGLIGSHQTDLYKDMVADIEAIPLAQQRPFVDSLFRETAEHTTGRPGPGWYRTLIDSAIREGRLPGERASNARDPTPATEADWLAVAAEYGQEVRG